MWLIINVINHKYYTHVHANQTPVDNNGASSQKMIYVAIYSSLRLLSN